MMFKKKCVWKHGCFTFDGVNLIDAFYPDCVSLSVVRITKNEVKKEYKVCPYCLRKIKIK